MSWKIDKIYCILSNEVVEFDTTSCYLPDDEGKVTVYMGKFSYERFDQDHWYETKKEAEEYIKGDEL